MNQIEERLTGRSNAQSALSAKKKKKILIESYKTECERNWIKHAEARTATDNCTEKMNALRLTEYKLRKFQALNNRTDQRERNKRNRMNST